MKTLVGGSWISLAEVQWRTNVAVLASFMAAGGEREAFVALRCGLTVDRLRELQAGGSPTTRERTTVDRFCERVDDDERAGD
jgi:hypothetical protein